MSWPQGVTNELTLLISILKQQNLPRLNTDFLQIDMQVDMTGHGPPESMIKTASVATACYSDRTVQNV